MTMDELRQSMRKAAESNNLKEMEKLSALILAGARDRAKVEAAALLKESVELAGKREALAKKIHDAIKALGLGKELTAVKAQGFRYSIDREELDGKVVPSGTGGSTKIVGATSLLVPEIKARKVGAGGGAGKTKDEFGMSLSEVFDQFATPADKTALIAAEAKDQEVLAKTGKTNRGYAHNAKTVVKKRALADGLIAPVK